jgi:hypothetical protein
MRNLIVLFTLLVMSSSAFAATYYLKSQSYNRSTGIRTCYYDGGHIRTTSMGRSCPSKITQ